MRVDRFCKEADVPPRSTSLLRFSTEMLPEHRRMAAFREELARQVVDIDILDLSDGHPRFDAIVRKVGMATVGSIAGSASDFVRDARHTKAGIDGFHLLLIGAESGPIRAQQAGRDHVCGAGSAFLMHLEQPYRGRSTPSGSEATYITVPATAMKELVANPQDRAGQVVHPSAALRLLDRYLQSLTTLEQHSTAELDNVIGIHLLDLMAAAVGPTTEAGVLIARRGLKAARLHAVLAAIARRCGDPAFDIDALPLQLGLSRRYIQHLLAETGKSFTEHLTECRLERARAMLANPDCAHMRIIDIAFAAGFGDLSNFNRLFRRRFGEAPSSARTRGSIQR
jgi:AraC-like DNA-binding protein